MVSHDNSGIIAKCTDCILGKFDGPRFPVFCDLNLVFECVCTRVDNERKRLTQRCKDRRNRRMCMDYGADIRARQVNLSMQVILDRRDVAPFVGSVFQVNYNYILRHQSLVREAAGGNQKPIRIRTPDTDIAPCAYCESLLQH